MIRIVDLWKGHPDAIAAVVDALDKARIRKADLRTRVAAWQKRHQIEPTGSLTQATLDLLLNQNEGNPS